MNVASTTHSFSPMLCYEDLGYQDKLKKRNEVNKMDRNLTRKKRDFIQLSKGGRMEHILEPLV